MKNSISWHFILFKTTTHKKLFTVLEGFLPEEQTRLRQRSLSKDSVHNTNINNKGCTHDHLSFWSYVLVYMGRSSCQQLTYDSIHKRKACLVIANAPGNKIPEVSNEWHQSMFGNKLMTALVTLKTMADQLCAWGISLKGVLVAVQCMRQYTENSPGCSTAKYTNDGGRMQYTTHSWKSLLAR